ncbi:GNAT family N-acetyltransferase [Rhodoferax sp.]|uniref:GNAT family N-acetyltransferase n=1 Tax=Rhodoferax sp. TaxID=50421 RepID=UPI002766D15B|nr:GNAT family N-acetyltransferase [Rhodoferax sp.]
MLEEQALDASRHDRTDFQCGEPALDEYLRKYAVQQSAKGITSIFVLVDDVRPSKILGFYTLSAAQVGVEHLGDAERKKLPRYPVPCFRMGRLARHIECRGTGMGTVLMGLAVDRCLKARSHVGAYALLVDAKDERAKAFYQQYGFTVCSDSPMALYLPLG